MADRYTAKLEVGEALPYSDARRAGAGGTTWTEPELDLDALRTEDGATPRDALAQALAEDPPDEVHVTLEGDRTELVWHEAAYGILALEPICAALREAQIAYRAWDEGRYEFPGTDEE